MTNREWLLNKMQNMSDEELAVFLDSPYAFLKIKRTECISNWLKSEHKEPITLSEAERIILENIDKEYKWIARDKDEGLFVYVEKPSKNNTWWANGSYNKAGMHVSLFNHLFQFITWNDSTPYNIAELLEVNHGDKD